MATLTETVSQAGPSRIDEEERTLEAILGDPGPVRFSFEDFVKFELKIDLDAKKEAASMLKRFAAKDPSILTIIAGLSKDAVPICRFWLQGRCRQGDACGVGLNGRMTARGELTWSPMFQMRHKADKSVVCKHWLRGLCKKGDDCEFLHEYNLKKMPECWFFTKYGECSNPECMYLHIDPNSKVKECAWYNRGFCKHGKLLNAGCASDRIARSLTFVIFSGAKCRGKHVKRAVCQNYLIGFCPKGPDCPLGHPKHELPVEVEVNKMWKPLEEVTCFQVRFLICD